MSSRHTIHHGSVLAAAFVLDPALIGAATARARALALWSPGARLLRLDDGALVVCLATPRRVFHDTAPGLPLTEQAGVLTALPLEPGALRALAAPRGAVVRMRSGVLRADLPVAPVDPAELLALDGYTLVRTVGLGAPPTPPAAVLDTPPPPRAALGVGDPPAAQKQTLAALQAAVEASAARTGEPSRLVRAVSLAALAPLALLGRLLGGLAGGAESGGGGRPSRADAAPTAPLPARPKHPLALWLQDRVARAVLRTRLGAHLARQHARYLNQMVDLFEKGDWDAALRHAIPLSRAETASGNISLGSLRPRESLAIHPEHARSGAGLPWGGLYDNLQTLYRRAFDQLVEAGRIEEAAFVLSELLQADEEAVGFLEKHGKLKLAAEMAEARELPPGLAVRQWWLAGDRERAVALARRTGAFADAIARLERTDPDAARTLRHLWARHLAATGNFASAVEAAWELDEAASERVGWLRKAVAGGGNVGARMLARQVAAGGGESAVDELLAEAGRDGAARRRHFAQELCRLSRFPERPRVARRTLRALLADASRGETLEKSLVRSLADAAQSPALRADLPLVRPPETPPAFDPPLALRYTSGDTGETGIVDAALLPDGRILVALGELGARLLARDGRTIASFDRPTHRLIVSDHGDRALLAGRRGESWRVSRLDLTARRASDWTELRLATGGLLVDDRPGPPVVAESFDGSTWLVALTDGLYALDALADGPAFLWRNRDLPGPVVRLHRTPEALDMLVSERNAQSGEVEFQHWHHELPSLILRYRQPSESLGPLALPNHGVLDFGPEGDPPQTLLLERNGQALPLGGHGQSPLWLTGDPNWALATLIDADGVTAHLVGRDSLRRSWEEVEAPRASLRFDGADAVCARFGDETLTLADTRGRLLVLDLATGQPRLDLRLRI